MRDGRRFMTAHSDQCVERIPSRRREPVLNRGGAMPSRPLLTETLSAPIVEASGTHWPVERSLAVHEIIVVGYYRSVGRQRMVLDASWTKPTCQLNSGEREIGAGISMAQYPATRLSRNNGFAHMRANVHEPAAMLWANDQAHEIASSAGESSLSCSVSSAAPSCYPAPSGPG